MQAYRDLAELAEPTYLVAQDKGLLQQACQEVRAAFREEIEAAFPPSAEPGASLKRPLGSEGESAHSLKMLSKAPHLDPLKQSRWSVYPMKQSRWSVLSAFPLECLLYLSRSCCCSAVLDCL